jgi:hypothetical protein
MTFPFDVKEMENGNFRDASNVAPRKTKRAVEVENDPSNPVPVYQTHGITKLIFDESSTVPDTDVSVINYTVSEVFLKVITVNISCYIEGKMTVFINGSKKATARTAPAKPDASIRFEPFFELVTGDTIEVKFKARPDSKIAEIESFINACECN